MSEIKLTKRYPHSRSEDITDAYTRDFEDGMKMGRGVCHIKDYEDTGYCVCSECGAVLPDDYTVYYCWNCGRKVVSE